ncbi:hypothetical protein [Roseibium salinum]|uniref:Uncharacterized protein n=1 Tax=Roseibium salinum TaxID=1604349 RepID=A0ABT3R4X8_9HYPH|nr:hypothetical protein [Roseibium sp. DSM 29163]MCX2724314.1 hypothetical protein [Roseibium sp. DSM 29163]
MDNPIFIYIIRKNQKPIGVNSMKPLLLITGVLILGGVTIGAAEDNSELLQPSYVGGTTGEEEYDTFAFRSGIASDLDIRFESDCPGKTCEDIVTNAVRQGEYIGEVSENDEKDTFGFLN